MQENDFDFDELDFKPITKGLGFHHKEKTSEKTIDTLEERSALLKKDFEKHHKENNQLTANSDRLNMGELAPFYSNNEKIDDIEIESNIETEVSYKKANKFTRLVAWGIDMSILICASFSVLYAVLSLEGLAINLDFIHSIQLELAIVVGSIFTLFYFFYFSVLEISKNSTLGKFVLGLRVRRTDSQRVSLADCFLRAFYSLLSFMSLGIFSLIDLQSSMTSTVVVKK